MTMTAAEHFEKAEQLLEDTVNYPSDEGVTVWTARARAHLDAARLLLHTEELMTSDLRAPRRTGMEQIAEKRRASNDI
jgi:hypothetical protein